MASLDPSIGMGGGGVPQAYAKIPAKDSRGEDQIAKFMEWNSDPVANHEANLATVNPKLADVIRLAQKKTGIKFVIGSGVRDDEMQKKAVKWGWSQTNESDHEHGDAADLWVIDQDGAVSFDQKSQIAVAKAMKAAAKELGVKIEWGGDWKGFQDRPHFAIKS